MRGFQCIRRLATVEVPGFSLYIQHIPHGVRRLLLRSRGDVGVGVQREAGGKVAQHAGDRFDVHAVLQRQCREGVPIRYNYDKPENPVFMVV